MSVMENLGERADQVFSNLIAIYWQGKLDQHAWSNPRVSYANHENIFMICKIDCSIRVFTSFA